MLGFYYMNSLQITCSHMMANYIDEKAEGRGNRKSRVPLTKVQISLLAKSWVKVSALDVRWNGN